MGLDTSSSRHHCAAALIAVLLCAFNPSAAAASGGNDPACANKICPAISLRPCTKLAPGGVSTGCKNGQCISGPIVNMPDGSNCGGSNVCWQGSCVPNKCAKKTCPAGATAQQATCNPVTGQCLFSTKASTTSKSTKASTSSKTTSTPTVTAASVVKPAQDGSSCGAGSVLWKGQCVTDRCQGKLCPVMSLAPCTNIAPGGTAGGCNPTNGNCEIGPTVPEPDGSDCGIGTCKGGVCVPRPGEPGLMQPLLPGK